MTSVLVTRLVGRSGQSGENGKREQRATAESMHWGLVRRRRRPRARLDSSSARQSNFGGPLDSGAAAREHAAMSRIAYVNGRYVRHAEAGVSIDDRAVVFRRWGLRSLRGARRRADRRGAAPGAARALAAAPSASPRRSARRRCAAILREVVARNRVRDGLVYLQVSRGVARRDHGFPAAPSRRD